MSRKFQIPASHVQILAFCIDDKNKPENATEWIEKDKLYELVAQTDALNYSEKSCVIKGKDGKEIHPTPDMRGFKEERFDMFYYFKN